MYSKNISGPRTVPYGTPDVTVTGEDCVQQLSKFFHKARILSIWSDVHRFHGDLIS